MIKGVLAPRVYKCWLTNSLYSFMIKIYFMSEDKATTITVALLKENMILKT